MLELDIVVRVEGQQTLVVEWPDRLGEEFHRVVRELLLGVRGVDAVHSTVYREVVQLAPHVTVAEVAAQDVVNALLDDSGAFYRKWRSVGYDEISASVRRW